MNKQPFKTRKPQKYVAAMAKYIKDGLSAKEISQQLQITEKTLGKWVRHGEWRLKRENVLTKITSRGQPNTATAIALYEFSDHLRGIDPELAFAIRPHILNYLQP